MASDSSYAAYITEQLAPLGRLTTSRFFGGTGFSFDSVQFGMIIQETLYFVVDDSSRSKYEALGSKCFSYSTKKGLIQVRRYFEAPLDVLDAQSELLGLARESIEIARRTDKSSKKRKVKQPI